METEHREMDELRAQEAEEEYEGVGKRRLFRFKPRFDVVLVREVIRCFPWSAGYGRTRSAWMQVAQRVQSQLEDMGSLSFSKGASLDHAIVKRRVDMLLDAFRKDEMAGLRGSGTPEDVEMRSKLLAILLRVVDEQVMNKGAMREKRVLQALQEAQTSLIELEETGVLKVTPQEEVQSETASAAATAASVAAAAASAAPLMPIAPAPPGSTVIRTSAPQNGNNKRPLRSPPTSTPATPASNAAEVAASLAPVTVKRQRVEQSDTLSSIEERLLRLEERRLALDEQQLAWEEQKAAQDTHERQALLDLLRSQSALLGELLTQLQQS